MILSVCRENEPKVSYVSPQIIHFHHLVSHHSASVYKPTPVKYNWAPHDSDKLQLSESFLNVRTHVYIKENAHIFKIPAFLCSKELLYTSHLIHVMCIQ